MINIDDFLLDDIKKLNKRYKETYGKEVNYSIIPKGLTQKN